MKASEQAVEEQPQAHTEAEAETLLPTLWKLLNRLLKVKKRSLKRKSLHSRNRS